MIPFDAAHHDAQDTSPLSAQVATDVAHFSKMCQAHQDRFFRDCDTNTGHHVASQPDSHASWRVVANAVIGFDLRATGERILSIK